MSIHNLCPSRQKEKCISPRHFQINHYSRNKKAKLQGVCIYFPLFHSYFVYQSVLAFSLKSIYRKKVFEAEVAPLHCHSPCVIWVPGLICDLFSRPLLWDSICFMKKGQVGSLNLIWNCFDIVLVFEWLCRQGVSLFSLYPFLSLSLSFSFCIGDFSFFYH